MGTPLLESHGLGTEDISCGNELAACLAPCQIARGGGGGGDCLIMSVVSALTSNVRDTGSILPSTRGEEKRSDLDKDLLSPLLAEGRTEPVSHIPCEDSSDWIKVITWWPHFERDPIW